MFDHDDSESLLDIPPFDIVCEHLGLRKEVLALWDQRFVVGDEDSLKFITKGLEYQFSGFLPGELPEESLREGLTHAGFEDGVAEDLLQWLQTHKDHCTPWNLIQRFSRVRELPSLDGICQEVPGGGAGNNLKLIDHSAFHTTSALQYHACW